ncbi:MAG: lytic murein transglycosylase [Pseudomonadota bacterium]
MHYIKKTFYFIALIFFFSIPAQAADLSFDSWLSKTKNDARQQGISDSTINAALNGIQPIQRVIELDRKQPEWKKTFTQYREMIVNPTRVKTGREMMQAYKRELTEVSQKYGVAPQYLVALWGIETNFGSNTGGFKVVPALATLAWEGRRAEFFTKELMNALKIIDGGHITAKAMKGSWAGAMGQNQFMPSSFNAYAVDENGDGKRDIWDTERDIFASSANYLKKNGWTTGQRWGRAVRVPSGFPSNLEGREVKKPLSFWASKGIKTISGGALPKENLMASLIAPDGLEGETYLVYSNYNTIMAWNRSTYFATSVGLLADAIAQ